MTPVQHEGVHAHFRGARRREFRLRYAWRRKVLTWEQSNYIAVLVLVQVHRGEVLVWNDNSVVAIDMVLIGALCAAARGRVTGLADLVDVLRAEEGPDLRGTRV